MVKQLKFLVFALLAPLALGACETPMPAQTLPGLTYEHLKPFRLDVAAVDVVSQYRSPMQKPNVEHLFPTPPEKALRRWAQDRLKAAGKGATARFVILDARATETPLKIDKSFWGAFKRQQSERYDATVEATLEILDSRGFRKGFANARASRSRTVREDATLNERERTWFELTEALMKDFDAELERNIRQHLGGFLF